MQFMRQVKKPHSNNVSIVSCYYVVIRDWAELTFFNVCTNYAIDTFRCQISVTRYQRISDYREGI